jgi:hypothetical protein
VQLAGIVKKTSFLLPNAPILNCVAHPREQKFLVLFSAQKRTASFLLIRRQPRRLILRRQRIDKLVELPLHDAIDLIKCKIDPMVRNPPLREIIRPDALAAITCADLRLAVRRTRRMQ